VDDKRGLKRKHLIHYMRVFNEDTGTFLGNLGDITAKGMMLFMEVPVAEGDALSLRMDFPEVFDNIKSVFFKAKCIWVKQGENETIYQAGFELLDSSETMLTLIKRAIAFYVDETQSN
jgi:hypothetical protein